MSTAATMTDLRNLRVDQVGGLCAPPALRRVYDAYKRGDAGESQLDQAKDQQEKDRRHKSKFHRRCCLPPPFARPRTLSCGRMTRT